MIYLDTHAVVWLYAKELSRFSKAILARDLLLARYSDLEKDSDRQVFDGGLPWR